MMMKPNISEIKLKILMAINAIYKVKGNNF